MNFLDLERTIVARMIEAHVTLLKVNVRGIAPDTGRGFWPQVVHDHDVPEIPAAHLSKAYEVLAGYEALLGPEALKKMLARAKQGRSAFIGHNELRPEHVSRMNECLNWPALIKKEHNRNAFNVYCYCKARDFSFRKEMSKRDVSYHAGLSRFKYGLKDLMTVFCKNGAVLERPDENYYLQYEPKSAIYIDTVVEAA
ncbi:hypothetical protein PsAD5_00141 [Pseudovibrio sp. Ad5]|uniref:hypothetical protein n=1 Tax=Pseudovibrio sp. Ad5 TaxID=989436 RepID=UPI0007B2ED96|nr:hypothetical protein [Pseudovibrio sp. Ad5]KZL02192.1 hypothetical protein PsAD5_00141 [Pseudovibrio sp. Ad5]